MTDPKLTYKLLWARNGTRTCSKKYRDVQKGVPNFRSRFRTILTSECRKTAVVLATWTQKSKHHGRTERQEILCLEHAKAFALRHGLSPVIYTDQSACQMMDEFKEYGGDPNDSTSLRTWIVTHGQFNLETEDWHSES